MNKQSNAQTTTDEKPTLKLKTAVSAKANGEALMAMQKQMEAMKLAAAQDVGKELLNLLKATMQKGLSSATVEFPTPHSNYSMALTAAACFRALRDQLPNDYVRAEAVVQKRVVLKKRLDENAFTTDVEKDSCIKQLAYYELLDSRLSETTHLLGEYYKLYTFACTAQYKEDIERQQDIPTDQKYFVTMPQLRWVKNVTKLANPDTWQDDDDLERLADRAKFAIDFTQNSPSTE